MKGYSPLVPIRLATLIIVAVALSGCGLLGKIFKPGEKREKEGKGDKTEKVEREPVRVAGEIASVHQAEGFVLIRRDAQGFFGGGTLVSSLSPAALTCWRICTNKSVLRLIRSSRDSSGFLRKPAVMQITSLSGICSNPPLEII